MREELSPSRASIFICPLTSVARFLALYKPHPSIGTLCWTLIQKTKLVPSQRHYGSPSGRPCQVILRLVCIRGIRGGQQARSDSHTPVDMQTLLKRLMRPSRLRAKQGTKSQMDQNVSQMSFHQHHPVSRSAGVGVSSSDLIPPSAGAVLSHPLPLARLSSPTSSFSCSW